MFPSFLETWVFIVIKQRFECLINILVGPVYNFYFINKKKPPQNLPLYPIMSRIIYSEHS